MSNRKHHDNLIACCKALQQAAPCAMKAAQTGLSKKIMPPLAGQAEIRVEPDLEAGNMLAKSLSFMADADAAGIVPGARMPIILTRRVDPMPTRLGSCAVAALFANAQRDGPKQGVV